MKKIIVLMMFLVLSACGYPEVISKESFEMAINKCAQAEGLHSLYYTKSTARVTALCLDGSTVSFTPSAPNIQ